MNITGAPYWDLTTTILYIIMGLIPVWAIYETDKSKIQYKKWWRNPYFFIWIAIWTVFGGGRLIGPGIGGIDAPAYMEYFENCLNPEYLRTGVMAQYNSNIGYRWLNWLLRLLTSNSYIFIVVESFLLVSCSVYFVSKFKMKAESCIPYFLIVFWYVRGFCTIRSNLAIATFMVSMCLLLAGKKKSSLALSLYAVLLHPMLATYLPFIIILIFKKNYNIGIKTVALIFFIAFSILAPIRYLFLQNLSLFGDLSEHYESYASMAGEGGFFKNAWKIAFEQLLLLIFMLFSQKGLKRYSSSLKGTSLEAYNMLYKLCMYDFILVPFCYGLGIWRGYEICYIPRLIMWAIIVDIGAKKISTTFRWAYNFVVFAAFIAWFLQRTGAESFWLETGLMPYVFAPKFYFF